MTSVGNPPVTVPGGGGGSPPAPPATPTLVLVVATSASIRPGDTIQLALIEVYSDGTTVDRTGAATWVSDTPAVATVAAGLVTAVAEGSAIITGTYGAFSDTASITVPAMVDVGPMLWGPITGGGPYSSPTAFNLNDADNGMGFVLSLPKDGSITQVGVYCAAIVGNPPAYNVSVLTVDSAGNPVGASNYGGSAPGSVDFAGAGWQWVTLATPATAVAGEIAAPWISPGGSAPDGSNYAQVQYTGDGWGFQLAGIKRGQTWITGYIRRGAVLMALKYSDGTVVGLPATSVAPTAAFGPTSSPDEYGAMFSVPVALRCFGCQVPIDATQANQPITFKLYDNDGSTVLGSVTISDEDIIFSAATAIVNVFWDPVTLRPGNNYRLTALPGGAGNGWQIGQLTLESAGSRIAIPEGLNWQKTTREDAGAWTQDSTILLWFGIWIDRMDIG